MTDFTLEEIDWIIKNCYTTNTGLNLTKIANSAIDKLFDKRSKIKMKEILEDTK